MAPGNDSGIVQELTGRGVPDRDARLYAAGVRAGDTLQIARTSDERADMAQEIMNRHGAIDIFDADTVRGGGNVATGAAVGTAAVAATSTTATAANMATTGTVETGERVAVPIIEEQLAVGKRQIKRGGAIIHKHVIERPVEAQVTLREEEVHVERHPVNRAVNQADLQDAFQERTIEVTETDEVPVVAKQARVVEEVVIGKEVTEHTETVRDTVRRTDVDVDEDVDTDVTRGGGAAGTGRTTTR